jgi:dienelactone hydrolase
VDRIFSGFTFGYNRPLLANRVHDIVTAVAWVKEDLNADKVYIVGFGSAGPWALLASALCGDKVARTAVDLNQFRFEKVTESKDDMMLPGALKYGGLPGCAALCTPGELLIHNTKDCGSMEVAVAAFKAAGATKRFQQQEEKAETTKVLEWLLR